MAALVDYTALTPATGWEDTFPVCASTPVDGIAKDFWRKVRIDFSLTNLTDTDWAKIMVIPAHTYVFEVMTVIVTPEGEAAGITVGDVDADHTVTWVPTQAGTSANVTTITLVATTNGATRGKYYHAAGALYISGTSDFDTLVIDVYAHCMTLDPL
jgi:hypothetical protein